jgi:MFS family permease
MTAVVEVERTDDWSHSPASPTPPEERKCIELSRNGCHCTRILGVGFTTALVGFCVGCYVGFFLIPELGKGTALGIVSLILFLPSFTLLAISLFRTYFTHPGKVGAAFGIDHLDRRAEQRRAQLRTDAGQTDPSYPGPVGDGGDTNSLIIPNRCTKCNVYKVHRIHHCSTCGECILRMDHHCPWIGNCVGRDNHKFFILFIFYTILTGSVMTATSAMAVDFAGFGKMQSSSGAVSGAGVGMMVLQFFGWIFTAIFTLVLIPFLIGIIFNATEGTTTLEKKILARNKQRRIAENRSRELASSSMGVGRRSAQAESGTAASNEPNATTPLTHIATGAHDSRRENADGAETSSDDEGKEARCCDCYRTGRLLSEIFGDSDECRRQSKLWWFLPVRPTFKPDRVNVDVAFVLI